VRAAGLAPPTRPPLPCSCTRQHWTALPPKVIGKLYKLTPTELRVLLAIVQVGGVSEVADALGIAESTVRTHLLRLFAKTGASANPISSS